MVSDHKVKTEKRILELAGYLQLQTYEIMNQKNITFAAGYFAWCSLG